MKNKPKKRSLGQTTQKTIKADAHGLKKFFKKHFTVMNILAVWGVLLTTSIAFTPRLYVYPSVYLDPDNPALTFFTVRNDGHFPISDVKHVEAMRYIDFTEGGLAVAVEAYENSFSVQGDVANLIYPREEYSFQLYFSHLEHNQIGNADIAIKLSFHPKWLPWWRKESYHRFVSVQGEDEQWHWLPQPINK